MDEEAGTEAQMAPPGVGGGPSDQDGDAAMEGARVAERTRRESVSRPAVQVGHREDKPKVFTGLDLYDPDAD